MSCGVEADVDVDVAGHDKWGVTESKTMIVLEGYDMKFDYVRNMSMTNGEGMLRGRKGSQVFVWVSMVASVGVLRDYNWKSPEGKAR